MHAPQRALKEINLEQDGSKRRIQYKEFVEFDARFPLLLIPIYEYQVIVGDLLVREALACNPSVYL